MKTLIIALNSKFIHSSPAPWYLKAACGEECGETKVLQFTVNENTDTVLSSIYLQKPDVAAFSCYIWNIGYVLKLSASLKKLLPGTVILLGGPEVSYNAAELLEKHDYIDYILAGEGEEAFPEMLAYLVRKCKDEEIPAEKKAGKGGGKPSGISDAAGMLKRIAGLARRSGRGIVCNTPAYIRDLDKIRSPYSDEMLMSLDNRIAYFESSRGCPFSCSYCLSSASGGTRYFSLGRVFKELDRLCSSGIRQVKFVDRTFNANKERAKAIIKRILEMYNEGVRCNFHFEVGADLFDDETMKLLESAPKGLFQLEAGVQSVNEAALAAVCRKTDLNRLFSNLRRLRKRNNVHVHADLIAGLPHEDYDSFGKSFDSVYSVKPHQLQLGFLKFLKGTDLRNQAEDMGYEFRNFPPYEVLSGRDISFDELIILKGVAELVERFYNSGRYLYSLDYVIGNCFKTPFEFYVNFYDFYCENGLFERNMSLREQYTVFDRFAASRMNKAERLLFRELLRLDFLASDNSGTLPGFMEKRDNRSMHDRIFDFLNKTEYISRIMPEAAVLPPKQLLKKIHFEKFLIGFEGDSSQIADSFQIGDSSAELRIHQKGQSYLLFNYFSPDSVTGRYPFFEVKL